MVANKTTAGILANFISVLDAHDQVFFSKLFLIIFDFAYEKIQNQDTTTQNKH
jgi:hypothetical protein